MPSVTLTEAQTRLPELISSLIAGEELRIVEDERVIAWLVRVPPPARGPRQPGSAKDKILAMAEDFDATPEDFREHLQ
jgi:antitoxin (DNA-binding transcriptional repressor) of toxin-antitoxin stability system